MSDSKYNCTTLSEELTSAGILSAGCNSNGIVWDVDGTTEIQNRADVRAVLNKHNPNSPGWNEIRNKRNILLQETDWTQLADAPLSLERKEMYAAYRQLLRDLPQNHSDTLSIKFPKKP